ncbi:lipopolysaccharide biosynthesis protein [Chryseobacterium balustinum]|uniref:Membrane protein involved in the export of O-antigen and teichoic acid n=2 Tax=Chryseobacterium balustinum TaxID=246 RepID=A0AAX2IRP2_9FLAO|nr:oligosaccharide flippase family protein [Chryseobacterium balustinum]SKB90119.1 Membrane protein involved in the export of O-antigen and teichoic acid [Chryseobacterium balustinum]SQA92311.1 Polysaccharide biosynthesis protein [Chryseobacterium balustinum]
MNFSSKKLTINAVSAVVQVVFTALLYFFLYKYLLTTIGVEQLGIWSLILSFSSIANLANMGLTSGLVKFVAEYILEDDKSKLGKLIFTSILSMSILFIFLSLVILSGAQFFLGYVIDKKFLDIALVILPYSLGSLCINAIGGVFTSVLEGHQKNYIRNFIYIISGIVMYVGAILLTPLYQLKGVAIAQLLQSGFIFLAAMIFTIKINPNNKIRHWKWSTQSFKELFNYGYKFQLVSVCQMLYEPATKLLLGKYGGLAFLGHYEMANKVVSQFRALLTNANQVVVPVVAEKAKLEEASFMQAFYIKMNRVLLLFNLPLSTSLIIAAPLISLLWLGNFNFDFIFSVLILSVATFFNVMCGPAYFSSMGQGRLNILVLVHIGMAFANIVIGIILGFYAGGYGIIIAWAIALTGGSLVLIFNYNKTLKISILDVFQKEEFKLILVGLGIIIFNILFYQFVPIDNKIIKIAISLSTLFLYLPFILKNENVKETISSIKSKKYV